MEADRHAERKHATVPEILTLINQNNKQQVSVNLVI